MSDTASLDPVRHALAQLSQAGTDTGDAVLIENDSLETRVRGDEIDFVKQARERTLGIRALIRGPDGTRSAITSTSDLAPAEIGRAHV